MKTFIPKKSEIEQKWFVIDATDKVVGRLATEIADILRGKSKPQFSPHMDIGDYVVVINAADVKLTGKKLTEKKYYKHTGYVGNLKEKSAAEYLLEKPTEVLFKAVKGMLPKNKLQQVILKKLHIYAGAEHKHEAQKPQKLEV